MNAPHENLPALRNKDAVINRMESALSMLAEADTITKAKVILDIAIAAETFAKRQKLAQELINQSHALHVDALRKIGEMQKASPKNAGARGVGKSGVPNQNPTLAELGLDKKTSSIAQKLADLPKEQFEAVRDGHESISKAIAKASEQRATKERAAGPKPGKPAEKSAAKPAAGDVDALRAQVVNLKAELAEKDDLVKDLQFSLNDLNEIQKGDHAKQMAILRASVKDANRARDDAMNDANQKDIQCKRYLKELVKLGWKKK